MRPVNVFARKMVDLAQAWTDMGVAMGNCEPAIATVDDYRDLEDKPEIRTWMEKCGLEFHAHHGRHIPLIRAKIEDWITAYRRAVEEDMPTARVLDRALSESWKRWVQIDHQTY